MFVLGQILRLLHPIMPFVTEQVYGEMPKDADAAPMLIVAAWPDAGELAAYVDEDAERAIAMVCEVVGAVRSHPGALRHLPEDGAAVAVKVADETDAALLLGQEHLAAPARQRGGVRRGRGGFQARRVRCGAGSGLEVYIVLAGHVDFAAERARLVKEREGVAKDAAKFEKKLSNPGFLAKAAPEIVVKDRAKLADLTDKLARLDAQIAELG